MALCSVCESIPFRAFEKDGYQRSEQRKLENDYQWLGWTRRDAHRFTVAYLRKSSGMCQLCSLIIKALKSSVSGRDYASNDHHGVWMQLSDFRWTGVILLWTERDKVSDLLGYLGIRAFYGKC